MKFETAIIIRDKTRLEQLIERFNSKAQAEFYIEKSGGDFEFFEQEHDTFYNSLNHTKEVVSKFFKTKEVHRSFLPTYIFTPQDLVIVIGQDGLVANTAKYADGLPIIGVNPDPERYDGALLKHNINNLQKVLKNVVKNKFTTKAVTMAKVTLNDGQELLAFNDFYIGASSHVSSRYIITFNGVAEKQSSSGILVSTGAGSTGWLSSIFNMANNINQFHHSNSSIDQKLEWNDDQLIFIVREPFLSKMSKTSIGIGKITRNKELIVESNMPTNGVIFSDGIESDFLSFNSGCVAKIGLANEKAKLIV